MGRFGVSLVPLGPVALVRLHLSWVVVRFTVRLLPLGPFPSKAIIKNEHSPTAGSNN